MTLNEFFHKIVDRLSFHTEQDATDLHAAVDEHYPAPEAPAEAPAAEATAPANDLDAQIAAAKAQLADKAKADELAALKAQLGPTA